MNATHPTTTPSRQLAYELVSGGSGLMLALFMWGHMVLVGSILTGERGFNWLATIPRGLLHRTTDGSRHSCTIPRARRIGESQDPGPVA